MLALFYMSSTMLAKQIPGMSFTDGVSFFCRNIRLRRYTVELLERQNRTGSFSRRFQFQFTGGLGQ